MTNKKAGRLPAGNRKGFKATGEAPVNGNVL